MLLPLLQNNLLSQGAVAGPSYIFKRNTNIYISKNPNASANATNTVQLSVKDFSYNIGSNLNNIGRSTLNPTQERTIDPFVAAISTVNFTFTTYVLSVVDTNLTSPEEYLWVSLLGSDNITSDPTTSTIDFSDGNVSELHNLTLWFNQPNLSEGSYRLDNAIIDSANISFNIKGITEIQWSGRALTIVEDITPPDFTDRTNILNFIKNKPSTISLNMDSVDYNLALIGGFIEINNNNIFYGRNKIGQTTIPVGHYTGNRTISGSLNFYMKTGGNQSTDLFNTILTNASTATYESNYLASITVDVGGSSNNPRLTLNIPQAILELGNQNFGELVSINVPFVAKEEASNYTTVTYTI